MTCRSIALSLLLVLATTLPAVGDTRVGEILLGKAPYGKNAPAIASNGDGFFAVWKDSRHGQEILLGTRVTADGTALDPTGILLAERSAIVNPAVIWNGSSWLVFYGTHAAGFHPGNARLWVVPVSAEGEVGARRELARNAGPGLRWVARNGSRIVAVYMSTDVLGNQRQIRALVLDLDGQRVTDFELTNDEVNRGTPSIASNGSEFLAVWTAFNMMPVSEIEAMRLDARGATLDARPRVLGPGYDPEPASDGDRWAILHRFPYQNSLVLALRVMNRDLTGVGTLTPVTDFPWLSDWSLHFIGNRYVILAREVPPGSSDIGFVAIEHDRDGQPIGTRPKFITRAASPGFHPQLVAATNGRDLVALEVELESPSGEATSNLNAYVIDATSFQLEHGPRRLSNSANRHFAVSIATSGTDSLVVWKEERGLFASRVANDGRILEDNVVVSTSATASPAAVVHDGTRYIMAWADAGLMIARAHGGGEEVRIAARVSSRVALASGDGRTIILWSDEQYQLRAARFDLPVVVTLSTPTMRTSAPAAAWNGSEFLVTFDELELHTNLFPSPPITSLVPQRVRGMRVSRDLAVRDEFIVGDRVETFEGSSSVASDGTDWLVVWNRGDDVIARRVLRNGGRLGTIEGTRLLTGRASSLTWNGASYILGWTNNSPAIYAGLVSTTDELPALTVATLISRTTTQRVQIAVAGNMAAYIRIDPSREAGHIERTFVRSLTFQQRRRAVR